MISTAALVLLVSLGGADVRAATPTLRPAAAPLGATAGPVGRIGAPPPAFTLRSEFLELDRALHPRVDRLAQRRPRAGGDAQPAATSGTGDAAPPASANAQQQPAPATPPTTGGAPAGGGDAAATTTTTPAAGAEGGAAAAGTGEAASTEAGAAPAEEEPSIDLLRQRERLTRIHRPLGIATWSSLLVTNLLGTVLAINLPTAFGPGNCTPGPGATGNTCFLGDFGSSVVPGLHTIFAISTVALYATTGIFALSMPDPEHASTGSDSRAVRLRLHKVMAWIHLVGMILQPVLGVIAAVPSVVGVGFDRMNPTFARDFQAGMRTIHTFVGWTTFAALTAAWILEF